MLNRQAPSLSPASWVAATLAFMAARTSSLHVVHNNKRLPLLGGWLRIALVSPMDRSGGSKPYAVIAPGGHYRQRTRPGAVWMIADAESGSGSLGYFAVGDRAARAVVPK